MRRRFADFVFNLALTALVLFLVFPIAAQAGPLEDVAEAFFPGVTGAAWWTELVAVGVAVAALLVAWLPKAANAAGPYALVRRALNWFAQNYGNARSEGE